MTSRMRGALVVAALLTGGSAAAEAQQGPMTFGPRALYDLHWEAFGIGAHLTKPVTDAISAYPSFVMLFADHYSVLMFNADLLYQVPGASLGWLSVGGGLNISRWSFDDNGICDGPFEGLCDASATDIGLNLIGHATPAGGGRIKPFGEVRIALGGGEGVQLTGGLKIPLGN